MKNFFFSFAFILLGLTTVFSQNLIVNKAETVVSFTIKNIGIKVDGTFSDIEVEAVFDKDNLSASYFSGEVATKSIDTGISARNRHLQKEDYFDAATYPKIKLVSKALKKMEKGGYEFIGELTIKGTTKPINFPIKIKETSNGTTVEGAFEVNRLDFKVGSKSWALNKTVKISIKLVTL